MRWQNREASEENVEDRRAEGSYSTGNGGKGLGLIGIIVMLVGAYYGVDLSGVVNTVQTIQSPQKQLNRQQSSFQESTEEKNLKQLSLVVLTDLGKVWSNYFKKQGLTYKMPKMVLYRGATHTACGTGQASAGPFYCPSDQSLYIDLSFYNTMKNELGADGDAAFAYVLAHEVGHHVQTLLGTIQKVHQIQNQVNKSQANALNVRLELQADCYAGVWGYYAKQEQLFENGDLEEAYNAAEAVGDDRLQKRAQGYTVPHTYTHGTSAQRKQWLHRGFETGNIQQCGTFADLGI